MSEIIPEGMRIRGLMGQLKTTADSFCERKELGSAQSVYERMKALVDKYPDQPDLVAALANSSVTLYYAYTEGNMPDRANQIRADIATLDARLSKNTKLRDQVVAFYKYATGM